MNFSTFIGVIFAGVIFFLALYETSPDNVGMFLDFHSTVIVIGGTLSAGSICFPILKVIGLLKVFFLRVLGKNKVDYQDTINTLLDLNKRASMGITALKDSIPNIKNDFLKEAVALVSSGVLNEKEIRTILETRLKTIETSLMHDANMFRTLGKFPPAFGLLATTLGMIALLGKIGQPGSEKMIGPAMSIGLIGTLYGISVANFFFVPIAENLTERTHEEVAIRRMIIEGVVLIKQQVNPVSLRETMNSFVLPNERVNKKAA